MQHAAPVYQSLGASEVRLLRVLPENGVNTLSCEMRSISPEHDNTPYIALSYVWGDDRSKSLLALNGEPMAITANLSVLLRHIREWKCGRKTPETQNATFPESVPPPETLFQEHEWIWADALCINQADIEEKSSQVPRMGMIYRSAARVVIWLGGNEGSHEEGQIHEIFEYANKMAALSLSYQDIEACRPYIESLHRQIGNTPKVERLCKGLLGLSKRPWFYRIWVLQEAALAREPPIVIAGGSATTFDNLHTFWLAVQTYLMDDVLRLWYSMPREMDNLVSLRRLVQNWEQEGGTMRDKSITDISSLVSNRLYRLLNRLGGQYRCTLPQDMIYGLLGMITISDLSCLPTPDYRRPWPEVFEDYARFLMGNTGDLTLMLTMSQSLDDSPSWVPDFRGVRISTHNYGVERSPFTLANNPFVVEDSRRMRLEGVELSTVVSSYRAPPTDINGAGEQQRSQRALLSFRQMDRFIFRRACLIKNASHKDVVTSWIESWINFQRNPSLLPELDTIYEIYGEFAKKGFDGDRIFASASPDSLKAQNTASMISSLLKASSAGSYFVTTDGMIGLLAKFSGRAEQGDKICVFKGLVYPALVRPLGNTYKFIASVNLNDGIKMYERLTPEHAYTQEFFDGHYCREFVLV